MQAFYRYVLYMACGMPCSLKACISETDGLFIPRGWDNPTKVGLGRVHLLLSQPPASSPLSHFFLKSPACARLEALIETVKICETYLCSIARLFNRPLRPPLAAFNPSLCRYLAWVARRYPFCKTRSHRRTSKPTQCGLTLSKTLAPGSKHRGRVR